MRGNTVRAVNVDMLATDDGEKSIIVNRPANDHCKLSITSSDKLISLRHGQGLTTTTIDVHAVGTAILVREKDSYYYHIYT